MTSDAIGSVGVALALNYLLLAWSDGWFFVALAVDWVVVTGICYRLMLRETEALSARS